MIINVRQGHPFSIDMFVEQNGGMGGPFDVSGSSSKWLTADGLFNPVCTTVSASDGRVRFYAPPDQTTAWPLGIVPAVLVFRGPTGIVHQLRVRVRVSERDTLMPVPDPEDHRGYQGEINDQGFKFTFVGTEDDTGGGGGSDHAFYRINVPGQGPIVADGPLSTFTVQVTGSGLSVTTDAITDTLKLQNTGVTSVNGSTGSVSTPSTFASIVVNGGAPIAADSIADSLYVVTGAGISGVGNPGTDTMTLTNTGVVSVIAGSGISVSAPTGAVTVSSTAAKTEQRVMASDFLVSSSVPATLHQVLVPAGGKIHMRAEVVLYTGGSTTNKVVWGFRCTQLGVADPEGPQLSYGCYNLRTHKTDGTSGYTYDQHAGGLVNVPVGVLVYSITLSPSIQVSGYGVGEIYMTNGGTTGLVVAVVVAPEVSGSMVTVYRGSSFISTLT